MRKSQCDKIWLHLREIGPLTQDDAKRLYHCNRLAARVRDLRERHGQRRISTQNLAYTDSEGVRVGYAMYIYVPPPPVVEQAELPLAMEYKGRQVPRARWPATSDGHG